MEKKGQTEIDNNTRRKMLKKATFIVPTIITFQFQSLVCGSSGVTTGKWDDRRPPAPVP